MRSIINFSIFSQEEIESLREKMSAQTSLAVVGSADDALRIKKFNRHMEGITQSMVDNMITDEVQDFVSTCIINPPGPREVTSFLNIRSNDSIPHEKSVKQKKRKHKDSFTSNDGATPRKGQLKLNSYFTFILTLSFITVGRPRLNKVNEIPTGKFKPERPKPTSALLKQSNEKLKMAIQNILPPPNDIPPVNLMSTDGDDVSITIPTEPTIINTSDVDGSQILSSYEAISTENVNTSNKSDSNQSPVKISSINQFVQLKPPTTTARIQSPDVKNFYIRKGVEKRVATHSYVTLRTNELQQTTGAAVNHQQISPNKKIVIKSQQIIKPANQQIIQTLPGTIINDSIVTASTDFSDILNLPILFADNEGNLQDHENAEEILSTDSTQIPSNILITSPDGKLPNRPVVISAANISKIPKQVSQTSTTTQANNKLIFINRNHLKTTTPVTTIAASVAKTIPPLKLVTTTNQQSSTTGTFTKLAPGTKIDLSTLKIVKSASTTTSGNILFNKTSTRLPNQHGRGAIVIKQSANPGGVPSHQVIKTGILNRNITVRKVVNLMPNQKISNNSPSFSTKSTPEKNECRK